MCGHKNVLLEVYNLGLNFLFLPVELSEHKCIDTTEGLKEVLHQLQCIVYTLYYLKIIIPKSASWPVAIGLLLYEHA